MNVNGFSPSLIRVLILKRSGFGSIEIGPISSVFDSYLPATGVGFLFPDDNLSTYQWIFTKLVVCIDIVEILFGIANGQISSVFDSYLPVTCQYFCF